MPLTATGKPLQPLLALLAAMLLTAGGCATGVHRDRSSPYYRVPAGSLLEIQRSVEIPPGRTRVFLQHGVVLLRFDHYAPNCNLEVRRLEPEKVQYVEPGVYRVRRVQRTLEEVVQQGPVRLAALWPWFVGLGDDGSPMVYAGWHLWLEGPDPNLMRLSCRGAYADLHEAFPPGVGEIREALGGIATLELAPAP